MQGPRAVRPMSAAPGDASRPAAQSGKPRSASATSGGMRPASALTGRSSEDAPLRRERMQSSAGYASPSHPPQNLVQDATKRAVGLGARGMPRPASALGATTGRVEIGRSRPGSAFARPKRPVSALGNLGRPDADKDGINAQGRHGVDSTNSEDAHAVHKDSGSFVAGDKMRPDSVGRNWRRPASALSRLPRASLRMPLHPMEQLGRGMGSDIGIDPSTQQLLADRELARKSDALIHKLHARNVAPDPFLEELRKEMQQEEEAQQQADADNASDDNDAEPASRGKRVRQITDLRPAEMARLQDCFKDDRGLHAGLPRTDFERVMREFTGMEGKLGGQLFCKIDANDDGTVEWDEFLDYIVQEAGGKLDASKHQAGCSIEARAAPPLFSQPKDLVGALALASKHRILVSIGLVRREVIFWNLDKMSKAAEVLLPTITKVDPRRPFTANNTVACRSMAYLQTRLGAVFVCSGSEPMIVQYDCRRFRMQRHLFTSATPSCMHVAWNPDVAHRGTNLEAGSWLLVGDVTGLVTAYSCKTFEIVGKYQAHTQALGGSGCQVNQVVLWSKGGGIVSAGDDGRIVVADYQFWKVKDYLNSEKLQTVDMVLQIVSDAKAQLDSVSKAEHKAAEAAAKAEAAQRRVQEARGASNEDRDIMTNARTPVPQRQDNVPLLPQLLVDLEEAKDQAILASRAVSQRRLVACNGCRLAMELLGGNKSLPRGMLAQWQRDKTAYEAALALHEASPADVRPAQAQKGAMVTGEGEDSETARSPMSGGASAGNAEGAEADAGDGLQGGNDEGGEGKAKAKDQDDWMGRPVTEVLTRDLEMMACFKGLGWDASLRDGKGEWTSCPPDWHSVSGKLMLLRSRLAREAEASKRPMVLSTGTPQTCVAVSEKFKVVLCGGKDRIIRVWNPVINLDNVGVDTLQGHGARIVAIEVLDQFGCCISMATDKTIKLWDLHTFQELCKLTDGTLHRPVDRLTRMAYDAFSHRLITFGNRGRVWAVEPRSIQPAPAVEGGGADNARCGRDGSYAKRDGLQTKRGKTTGSRKEACDGVVEEEMLHSGWTVVNVRDIALRLEHDYGDGKILRLPNLDLLTGGGRFEVKQENMEEIENDKWIELHDYLEKARQVGVGEPTIRACYSSVFHQYVVVGVHHCFVMNLETGLQVCRFRVSRPAAVTACSLDASERRLFTGAHDGSVRSWNFNSGVMLAEYQSMQSELTSIIFLPQKRSIHRPIVAGGWDKKVTMWSELVDEDCENLHIGSHGADILCLEYCDRSHSAFLPLLVLSGDAAGHVMVWEAGNGRLVHHWLPEVFAPTPSVTEGSGGRDVVSGLDEKRENQVSIFAMLHLAGSSTVLVSQGSGDIHEMNMETRSKVSTVRAEIFHDAPRAGNMTEKTDPARLSLRDIPDAATVMAVNANNTRLFVGEASGALQMWRLTSIEPLSMTKMRRFQGHLRAVVNISFSPSTDTGLWVTAGGEGSVRIWTRSGKSIHVVSPKVVPTSWTPWLTSATDKRTQMSSLNLPDEGPRDEDGAHGNSENLERAMSDVSWASEEMEQSEMVEVEEEDEEDVEEETVPFHVRCPPFVPKSLTSKGVPGGAATTMVPMLSNDDSSPRAGSVRSGARVGKSGGRVEYNNQNLIHTLDSMHLEACQQVSAEVKWKLATLETRHAGLYKGVAAFPTACIFSDLLPPGNSAEDKIVRLEEECAVIEALNQKRVLIKDAFRTYAASMLTEITSLNTVSMGEVRSFIKDMRCSTRVSIKLAQIYHATLTSSQLVESEGEEDGAAATVNDEDKELGLAKFVEFIVRVSKEQVIGKDNLAKKVQMFLNTMARHCKGIVGPTPQVSVQSEVAAVLKRRQSMLKRIYMKYCSEDQMQTQSLGAGCLETMNLRELFQLVKDCNQMDSKFSVSKLATAFIAANSCGHDNGDDGSWTEWDWELTWDEFQEVLVRIVDMRTKTAQGQLADKLDSFIVDVIFQHV